MTMTTLTRGCDSLFLVIRRMLEVKEHLTTFLELEWENLNVAH